ncbi:MAG: MFS transporter, partial [Thermogemmatispora sp.]|uniref:MFS transporter n=1 Tax=Thermogemmatispora sp. TaxID=1968838 RepID=UPI0026122EB0
MKSAASWLEVQLLIALALAAQGKVRRALKILGVVLARAEPEGYLRLFADEGQPLARLLALVSFLAALDQTIVATALPTIVGELHGFSSYAWVGTAYLLTMTTMIPLVGKLSDQFGRKWLLLVGIVLFLLGAALAGLIHCHRDDRDDSWTADWRAITEHTSWRWIFYLNLLLGMVALACIAIWLPASISVRATRVWGRAGLWRLDLPGSLTAAAATVCLLLGLSWGGETYPWASVQVVGLSCSRGSAAQRSTRKKSAKSRA